MGGQRPGTMSYPAFSFNNFSAAAAFFFGRMYFRRSSTRSPSLLVQVTSAPALPRQLPQRVVIDRFERTAWSTEASATAKIDRAPVRRVAANRYNGSAVELTIGER